MDLERLNTSQIILLTLLTSFVTSIATGIVTVTLMDQAPPVITQTLERVVEKTVSQVTPTGGQSAAVSVATEKATAADAVPQAVSRISVSLVRVYTGVSEAPEFLGFGVVVAKSGLIVTDLAILPEAGGNLFVATNSSGLLPASVLSRGSSNSLSLLQGATTTQESKVMWRPAIISSAPLSLGQTVVSIAGKNTTKVDGGIVSAVSSLTSGEKAPRDLVDTNIPADSIGAGGPLINTDGELVGISTHSSRSVATGGFLASSAILLHINSLGK